MCCRLLRTRAAPVAEGRLPVRPGRCWRLGGATQVRVARRSIFAHASAEVGGTSRCQRAFSTCVQRKEGWNLASLFDPDTPLDPGRRALQYEYLAPGRTLLDLPLEFGGSLQVTSHTSDENEAPPGTPEGTTQEWRVLRFTPAEGSTNLMQSVAKVCLGPLHHSPAVWLRSEALPLDYTKTVVSIVLAGLSALGAPVLPEVASKSSEPLRILCIGLGGGSMPSFFAQRLANCEVDVVELEKQVVHAATKCMGFVPSPRLRVHVEDGASFALRAAKRATEEGRDGAYDAVVIDAYNAAGDVPGALWSEGSEMAEALSSGLLRRRGGLVATNFLPFIDLGPPSRAYREALAQHAGFGFSVQGEGSGNRLLVQTCGGPPALASLQDLAERLREEASKVADATGARNIIDW